MRSQLVQDRAGPGPAPSVERRPDVPLPRSLTTDGVLALQRAAGNRATVSSLGRMPRRTLSRFVNLAERIPGEGLDKRTWELFVIAQKTLRNVAKVQETLKILQSLAEKSSLSEALQQSEKGFYKPGVPRLIGFVPPSAFQAIVRSGHQFEDLVAPQHGRKSHRIQFYVLGVELGPPAAAEVYREAVNPKWNAVVEDKLRPEQRIWDLIVDVAPPTNDPMAERFLAPDAIQKELTSGDYGTLTEQASTEQVGNKDDLAKWEKLRPKTREELKSNRLVFDIAQQVPDDPSHDIFQKQDRQAEFLAPIVDERLVHSDIEWTGWLPMPFEPFLQPTVAYPLKGEGAGGAKERERCIIM